MKKSSRMIKFWWFPIDFSICIKIIRFIGNHMPKISWSIWIMAPIKLICQYSDHKNTLTFWVSISGCTHQLSKPFGYINIININYRIWPLNRPWTWPLTVPARIQKFEFSNFRNIRKIIKMMFGVIGRPGDVKKSKWFVFLIIPWHKGMNLAQQQSFPPRRSLFTTYDR